MLSLSLSYVPLESERYYIYFSVCAFTFEITVFTSGVFNEACCASSVFFEASVASARLVIEVN